MKKKERRQLQKRFVRKMFERLWYVSLIAALMAGISVQVQAGNANGEKAVKAPPEFVDINIQKSCPGLKGLKKDLKSVRHFSHRAHIEFLKKEGKGFVCATCHHGAKTEADILDAERCKRVERELEATGGPGKLRNHFHGQCLGCHKKMKKAGKKTGPVSCKGCHNRKGAEK